MARLEAILLTPFRKRGLGTAYQITGSILKNSPTCRAEIAPDAWMPLPILDPYWGPTAVGRRPYEPEIAALLERLLPHLQTWGFLDCGANFGYWSAFVSGSKIRCNNVAAVEFNPSTYNILLKTADLNGGFKTFHAAISDRTGNIVLIENANQHAAAHVGPSGIPVVTLSIDDVLQSLKWFDLQSLIIKLDVEGQEPEACAGAAVMRARISRHLFIYEDHGGDPECKNTRAFMDAGYIVCSINRDGTTKRINGLTDARAVKLDVRRGYNFVATMPQSEFAVILC